MIQISPPNLITIIHLIPSLIHGNYWVKEYHSFAQQNID